MSNAVCILGRRSVASLVLPITLASRTQGGRRALPRLVRWRQMRGRARRQSRRRTRFELHRSLTADGATWVKEVWQAAESVCARLSLLSPLTNALGMSFADSYAAAELLEGEEIQQAFFAVMMAGYASRTVLVSPTQQPPFDPASFTLDASLDVEQIANDTAVVGELTERVRSIAFDDFDSVMTLPPGIWAGYVALATMRLQRNLASSTLPGRELSKERIERMLRYGYVLRCLDEALDGEPQLRED
jgi:hypothetical protein